MLCYHKTVAAADPIRITTGLWAAQNSTGGLCTCLWLRGAALRVGWDRVGMGGTTSVRGAVASWAQSWHPSLPQPGWLAGPQAFVSFLLGVGSVPQALSLLSSRPREATADWGHFDEGQNS